ncbi:MAG: agmatinase [Candidatus Baldrarchaeia archaeon]
MVTFLNFPRVRLDEIRGLQAIIIGVPFDRLCFSRKGSKKAPDAIRRASLIYSGWIPDLDIDVCEGSIGDAGNLKFAFFFSINRCLSLIEDAFMRISSEGVPFVAMGGDHSISFPIIRGISKNVGSLGILWLDAHLDFMKEYPRGFRLSYATVLRNIIEKCNVNPRNIAVIGFRGYSTVPNEYRDARKLGLNVISSDVVKKDIRMIIRKITEIFEDTDVVYVSLDVDVIDPAWAPGVSNPEPAGLSPTELITLIRGIRGDVVGFDLVEVTPTYDSNGITCSLCSIFIIEMLARILQTDK